METMRRKLLCLVAGLLAAVLFVSAQPFSRGVSRWVAGVVLSILPRAETAAQYLVIVQARVLAAKGGLDADPEQFLKYGLRDDAGFENAVSLSTLRERLEALRALLEDLPRHGLRLLRRIEKRVRRLMRETRAHPVAPSSEWFDFESDYARRLAGIRIERPPDKGNHNSCFKYLPPLAGGRRRRLAFRRETP